MKALSVSPWWSTAILQGAKTVECRTWQTNYRGDLLICTSSRREPGGIPGHAICIVELVDIVPFTEDHIDAACMCGMPGKPSYAWLLGGVEYIEPFPVKGRLHLFDVPDDSIHIIEGGEDEDVLREVYRPLVYFGDDPDARDVWDF